MAKNTVLKVRNAEQNLASGFERLEAKSAPGAIWSNIG
jgi:hypothetical protein